MSGPGTTQRLGRHDGVARAPLAHDARRVVGMLDQPAGAYVHIPFCSRICPFCPYNKVIPRHGQEQRYFRALLGEISLYLDAGTAGADGFTSLYVGGGTPTLFPDQLRGVVEALPVAGERAIEVLPTHGTPYGLDELRSIGFNAVSIGAQSFSDDVLHHLRRPHDARQAREAMEAAIGRFDLVDVDLIFDVEYDDTHEGAFLRDLETCLASGVDQVSTYPLMRFGYTPFGKARHDRRREHRILAEATRIAREHGYVRRSVWTFNKPASQSYTSITRRRFVGMGAGASSYLGRDFLVNHFGVETYIGAVEEGRLPLARHYHLGPVAGGAYDWFWRAYSGELPTFWFDRYHDLERLVTYQLIEPLWAEMLAEHEAEGANVGWAAPASARRGRLWPGVSRVMRRPV